MPQASGSHVRSSTTTMSTAPTLAAAATTTGTAAILQQATAQLLPLLTPAPSTGSSRKKEEAAATRPADSQYITLTQRTRLDMAQLDVASDAARLKRALQDESLSERLQLLELAQVCGWPRGLWGATNLEHALSWHVCAEEAARFAYQYVRVSGGWCSRVPEFRVVLSQVRAYLPLSHGHGGGSGGDRWSRHDEALYNWEAEDHYTRFILRFVAAMHDPERYRALVRWIRAIDNVDELVYILYSILLFVHYRAKQDLYKELPHLTRLGLCIAGGKGMHF